MNETPLVAAELIAKHVTVTWQDHHQASFHNIWLRHSPGYPGSSRPASEAGRFPSASIPIIATKASIDTSGDLQLIWNNGYVSKHRASWLRKNSYDKETLRQRRRHIVQWESENVKKHIEFDFNMLSINDNSIIDLFEHILDYGVAILRNVPTKLNTITEVGSLFGHMPANLYSDNPKQPTIGNIKVDPSVSVATNMCHFLGPHTDTCWRQTLSGLILLHCLKSHPEGGRSIVVDGFVVASRLRNEDPVAYELLTRIPIDFGSKVGEQDDWRAQGRIISIDAHGNLEGIRYNGNSIGQLELPAELIEPVYHALEKFEAILYDKTLWWQPMLQDGDLLIVDNHRVLHGREAFDPGSAMRHLQTCAVDRDDFHNNYRRLAKKLNKPDWNLRLSAGVI